MHSLSPKSKIWIRQANPEKDIDGILEIQKLCYHAGMRESFDVFESIVMHGWSYVAIDVAQAGCSGGHGIVGYLVAHPWHTLAYPPRLHARLEPPSAVVCLFIHDVAVHPEHRRLGVAKMLVRTFCKRLTEHPIPFLPCTFVAVHGTAERHVDATRLACEPDILRSYADPSATYMMVASENVHLLFISFPNSLFPFLREKKG